MNLDATCILLLLNTFNKKVEIYFLKVLHTVFSSIETIPWNESSRLLYYILDMLFNASCLANLSDICDYFVITLSGKDHSQK